MPYLSSQNLKSLWQAFLTFKKPWKTLFSIFLRNIQSAVAGLILEMRAYSTMSDTFKSIITFIMLPTIQLCRVFWTGPKIHQFQWHIFKYVLNILISLLHHETWVIMNLFIFFRLSLEGVSVVNVGRASIRWRSAFSELRVLGRRLELLRHT